jgi:hypothetical protein
MADMERRDKGVVARFKFLRLGEPPFKLALVLALNDPERANVFATVTEGGSGGGAAPESSPFETFITGFLTTM